MIELEDNLESSERFYADGWYGLAYWRLAIHDDDTRKLPSGERYGDRHILVHLTLAFDGERPATIFEKALREVLPGDRGVQIFPFDDGSPEEEICADCYHTGDSHDRDGCHASYLDKESLGMKPCPCKSFVQKS